MMLSEADIPMPIISRLLGHETIEMTVDTCGHVPEDVLRDVARKVDDVLWGSTGS